MKYDFKVAEEMKIREVLLEIGVPCHIRGHAYLRSAVMIAMQDEEAVISITKYIYPEVAKIYYTTDSKVERAIRSAIELAWGRHPEGFRQLFRNENMQYRPTNSEFIAEIAEAIKKRKNI